MTNFLVNICADTLQPRAGRAILASKNMTNITTHFTETELVDLGRAMEQAGFTSLESFIKNAVEQHKNSILSAGK